MGRAVDALEFSNSGLGVVAGAFDVLVAEQLGDMAEAGAAFE